MAMVPFIGFRTLDELKEELQRQSISICVIFFYRCMYYAVAIESHEKLAVVGSNIMWYRNNGYLIKSQIIGKILPYSVGSMNEDIDIYHICKAAIELRNSCKDLVAYTYEDGKIESIEKAYSTKFINYLASVFLDTTYKKYQLANIKPYFYRIGIFKELFIRFPYLESINPHNCTVTFGSGSKWTYQEFINKNGVLQIGDVRRVSEIYGISPAKASGGIAIDALIAIAKLQK